MWVGTVSILVALLTICGGQNEEARIVTLTQGPVRGYRSADSEVFQFFGIPYATAPTGADKFKAPLAPRSWTDTFEATQDNISCPTMNAGGQEDCLIANVFTPATLGTNLPVLVFIHVGGYRIGVSTFASPRPLVESQRIVAVTINYRLGAHGFLCLGTEDVPGNAGLKDMLAGLRWVRDNIASFGGNPNDVTLAGGSAGASATDLLSLSRATEGLFNKIIADSAASVASWSVQLDPIKNAQNFAAQLGFNNVGDLTALENFYKSLSFDELTVNTITPNDDLVFIPCVENDIGQEMILDDSPVNIIRSGNYAKIPALYSFTNMEGRFRLPRFDQWAPLMNQNFTEFLVPDLTFENDSEKESVAQSIKQFYFGNRVIGIYTLFDYINYFTDSRFAYPILRTIKLRSEAGQENIYLYEYHFYNINPAVPGVPDILVNFPGANHVFQTNAALERRGEVTEITEEYRQMRVLMRELWINFITTGTPSPAGSSFPTWPAVNASRSPHMIIGDSPNSIELGGIPHEARAQLWDSLYEQYYLHPIPPVFVEFEVDENNHAGIMSGSILLNLIFIGLVFVTRY